MSEQDFELQVLRSSRQTGSTSVPSRSREISSEVIEASIARSAVMEASIEKMYKPELLEASEKAFPKGLSLIEFFQICAKRNGFMNISHRDIRSLLEGAFAPVQASAHGPSTYNVGGILSNIANKMIKDAFMAVEQEWTKIAAIGTVSDLKKHTSFSLTGDMSYEKIGVQGEIKHATLGEEKYENQASTFGRIFSLSEDDLINDDLGAFNRIQRLLGRGSALSLNKTVWTEFLANSATFWTAARANRMTGAASALSIGALTTASTMLEKQTDPDGNPMGVMGSVLVVPTELKIYANQLANDTEIRMDGNTTPQTYSVRNPHAGKFAVAGSAYLNNANIAGGSATHWALLANPNDLPTIEVVFLNGQMTPRVEQARANFDTLGVYWRGIHRMGASKQEYRASVYSAGV
jgi:phage major head subunit gpT-like protein